MLADRCLQTILFRSCVSFLSAGLGKSIARENAVGGEDDCLRFVSICTRFLSVSVHCLTNPAFSHGGGAGVCSRLPTTAGREGVTEVTLWETW